MMVPRAYMYASPTPGSARKSSEKDLTRASAGRSPSRNVEKKKESGRSANAPNVLTPPPSLPSKPVVIPTRTRNSDKRRSKREDEKSLKASENTPSLHDATSMPSSVAALLAITSIPGRTPKALSTRKRGPAHGETIDRCRADSDEASWRALSSSSPQTWDFLLSPPDEDDLEIASFKSDTTLGPLSSVRSMSTESMPSLATDEDSISSASNPATPSYVPNGRSSSALKQKSLATSRGEDSILDHPLLPLPSLSPEVITSPFPDPQSPVTPKGRNFFKSNLTASFRVLRSAARSFSTFTSPPHTDTFLTSAVLAITPESTDDRRPLPSLDPPDPALRRYLNPITLSPAELHFHNDTAKDECKSSVQLQTYEPGSRRSNASSPPIFLHQHSHQNSNPNHSTSLSKNSLDEEDVLKSSLLPRQREPRENSDFLRVIVLEMNMRKCGKLSEREGGKARLWLPPRQVGQGVKGGEGGEGREGRGVSEVPRRWVGVRA